MKQLKKLTKLARLTKLTELTKINKINCFLPFILHRKRKLEKVCQDPNVTATSHTNESADNQPLDMTVQPLDMAEQPLDLAEQPLDMTYRTLELSKISCYVARGIWSDKLLY